MGTTLMKMQTTLSGAVTGIDHWLMLDHSAEPNSYLTVAIDPPNTMNGSCATVPFDPGKLAEGPIDRSLDLHVREFIGMNRPVLMDYLRSKLSTDEFIARLKSVRHVR